MTVRSRHQPYHPFCYSVKDELLEYDYNYDDSNKPPQEYPRIRERGEYYVDSYNEQPWSFTFGTHETVRATLSIGVHSVCVLMFDSPTHSFQRMELGATHLIKQDQLCQQWSGF
jgi:hypothetical protein